MSTSGRKRRARKQIRNNAIIFATILKMTNMVEYHEYGSKPYHPGEHLRMVDIERFERRDDVMVSLVHRFQTATPLYFMYPERYQRDFNIWIDSEYWKPGAKIPKSLKAACMRLVLFEKSVGILGEALKRLTTISVGQQTYFTTGGSHNEENNAQTEEMGD